MRAGNLLQILSIFVLIALTAFEHRNSQEKIHAGLYRLRVQKSFQNRQSFENEYGKDWKQVIKLRIAQNQQFLLDTHTHMKYKMVVILLLSLVALFHFIKYYYIGYNMIHKDIPLHRYDASTWFINFLFFAIVSFWYAYFSNGGYGAVIGYILGILCITKCLWHITQIVQTLQIRKLKAIRIMEIGIAAIIYFHLISFVILYYAMIIMRVPVLVDLVRNRQ